MNLFVGGGLMVEFFDEFLDLGEHFRVCSGPFDLSLLNFDCIFLILLFEWNQIVNHLDGVGGGV